ncbi:MAG: class I SAM-dependent methyltransferase [Microthrixaceae bacterium]
MPDTDHRYDRIGGTYSSTRVEDPRIAAQIGEALGEGPILNIGAGSGNYEPANRQVVGLEPSTEMIRQRSAGSAPVVRRLAESLPFGDHSFGTAMAILTIHHWTDPAAGLTEMARVADRQVVFFFEQDRIHGFWAIDYFPRRSPFPPSNTRPASGCFVNIWRSRRSGR